MPSLGSGESACGRVQRALIEGTFDAAGRETRAHVDRCPECLFFRELSRDLSGGAAAGVEPGPLSTFVELFERAVESGETLLSRYRPVARLGSGGQGVVYRALDTDTGETIALKLVRCPANGVGGASLEVALARRVRHPGICRAYHTERHGDVRLISMEFVAGSNLHTARDSLSARRRLDVFRQVCEAVQAAHDAGVLHLDLKPANILIRSSGEAIVTDFGLAARTADGGSHALPRGGTPRYMAPEQVRREPVDARADVYALGRLLADLFPDPSRHLQGVIRKSTSPDRTRRYADVRSLWQAVQRPQRWRRRALLLAVASVPLAAFASIHPPAGPRAQWFPQFGVDHLPAEAWNVALNTGAGELPSVSANHEGAACARNRRELVDGLAHYMHWEHGFAFPGIQPVCVSLDNLGHCGSARDDAPLCLNFREPGRRHRTLNATMRERHGLTVPDGARLGQLEPGSDCGSDNVLTVTLERPHSVSAVRAWYRSALPVRYRVEVEEAAGWRQVFATTENLQGRVPPYGTFKDGEGGFVAHAEPVTTEFPPVRTRRVRLSSRCEKQHHLDPGRPGEPIWLYEIEVFARVSRLEAWRRFLFP